MPSVSLIRADLPGPGAGMICATVIRPRSGWTNWVAAWVFMLQGPFEGCLDADGKLAKLLSEVASAGKNGVLDLVSQADRLDRQLDVLDRQHLGRAHRNRLAAEDRPEPQRHVALGDRGLLIGHAVFREGLVGLRDRSADVRALTLLGIGERFLLGGFGFPGDPLALGGFVA